MEAPIPADIFYDDQFAKWHTNGNLPHIESIRLHQIVTYRLADSLPHEVAKRLIHETEDEPGNSAYRKRLETFLDAGHGSCVLRCSDIAEIIRDAWLHDDGVRYHLRAWCIMPNHVHILFQPIAPWTLATIVKTWKQYTARRINPLIGSTGTFWQAEYWDRYIRDAKHYQSAFDYILQNPVKAGLADSVNSWLWSGPK